MDLVDTHCHIHEVNQAFDDENETRIRWKREGDLMPAAMIRAAAKAGVTRMICVGTTLADSKLAVEFAQSRPQCWASIGIHPHEAKNVDIPLLQGTTLQKERFAALATRAKVVAVGECGLDYFYGHSSKADQAKVLRFQIELALEHDLPLIFHVRDAFADFWQIFDEYKNVRGVIHSFSAGRKELEQILQRNLYVGLNGIMTFTKDAEQLAAAKTVPPDKLVIETDAPFLTPVPYRGTLCQPKHVRATAEFLANLRGESLESFADVTTRNAHDLFGFLKRES
jgi:TatD DNase family protein